MTCGLCFDQGDATKCLLTALESIRAHVLILQKTSSDDAKTISNLQLRNEKLHKALELKQKQVDFKNNHNFHVDKRRKLSLTKKTDEISPMPHSQNTLNMNIAINSVELSPSEDELIEDEDETIAETESATKRTPRKLCRKWDTKNLENVQPMMSWMGKTPQNQSINKLSLTRRGSKLKQTRLEFKTEKQPPQEAIEDSPNLFTSLKQAKQSQSRSLLQKNDKDNDFVSNSSSSGSGSNVNESNVNSIIKTTGQNPNFDLELADDEEMLKLVEQPILPPPATLPIIKSSDTTSDSLILMTPATQDIVFLDDSSDDISNLGTMDLMAEVIKEDQSKALQNYEKRMIEKQKQRVSSSTSPDPYDQPCPRIKDEPKTQNDSDVGNESTKLVDEIEKYLLNDPNEEEKNANKSAEMAEESFPRPLVIKAEKELSLKEKFNIQCEQCEKLISFMGSNLNEKKIQDYLLRCRHQRTTPLTPPGFWNPLMESLAADDPRNEVLIDTRFKRNQQQGQPNAKK